MKTSQHRLWGSTLYSSWNRVENTTVPPYVTFKFYLLLIYGCVESGDCSLIAVPGFSLQEVPLLRSTGPRLAGSVVEAHGLCCPRACDIFLDQGSNLHSLHWEGFLTTGQPRKPSLLKSYLLFPPSVTSRRELSGYTAPVLGLELGPPGSWQQSPPSPALGLRLCHSQG